MSICTPRTDAISVKAISGSTLDNDVVDSFIQAATVIIDSVQTCATNAGVTDMALAQAETWLTAHLLAVSNVGQSNGSGIKKKETFENYSVEWSTAASTGQGILATHYGMTANALTLGCLQEADKRNVAILFAGGE